MTASEIDSNPDFFEDHVLDPMAAATGARAKKTSEAKKKAGFYLPESLLRRFDRRFHQMKLAGLPIGNKSHLMALALAFALDDLEKETDSRLLSGLRQGSHQPAKKR